MSPPKLGDLLLHLLLPNSGEAFRGDLEEEYSRLIVPRFGRQRANLWYWKHALAAIVRYGWKAADPTRLLAGVAGDVRYSFRGLARAPGFALVVLATLGLGIGSATAVFSVADAFLFRPLPYPNAERLVYIRTTETAKGDADLDASFADFTDWRKQSHSFEEMAAFVTFGFSLSGESRPEAVRTTFASASLFRALGVSPILGRTFIAEEDRPGGDIYQAVISHELWQRHFGAEPDVLGRKILLDLESYTVLGVMPPGFRFPDRTDIWAPAERWSYRRQRNIRSHSVIALLRPGMSLVQANDELRGIAAGLAEAHPQTNAGAGAIALPLREAGSRKLKSYVMLVCAAVSLLLLIACGNVANLMLARSEAGRREMAVRRALGVNRFRLIRQLLIESLLLAFAGAALGVTIANWGTAWIITVIPQYETIRDAVSMDRRVLLFSLLAAISTGLLFGLAPLAMLLSETKAEYLKQHGANAGASMARSRLRKSLLIGEIAFSALLLTVAGELMHTLERLGQVQPGFDSQGLLALHISMAYDKYPKSAPLSERIRRQNLNLERIIGELERLPGVISAAGAEAIPFESAGPRRISHIVAEGQSGAAENNPTVAVVAASPGFFRVMGVPLISGRVFTRGDNLDAAGVAVINQSLARRLFPQEDAAGHRIKLGTWNSPAAWLTVAGVTGDMRYGALNQQPAPMVYLPQGQSYPGVYTLVARTTGDPALMAAAAGRTISRVDPEQAVFRTQVVQQMTAESVWQQRLATRLMTVFASVALLLAAVGVYGVISYFVTQRKREIGVRIAVGATPGQVLGMMLRESAALMLTGLAAGLLLAVVATRSIASMLYDVSPLDLLSFAAAALAVSAAGFVAVFVPAVRATQIHPLAALRSE